MMRLLVISAVECFDGETELINGLFEAGMEILHLRKPGINLPVYLDLLEGIDQRFQDRLVLHQFHDQGLLRGIRRFHFSEKQRMETDRSFKMDMTWSTSVHRLPLADDTGVFDYVFFGPVFDSISKPGYLGTVDAQFRLPETGRQKLIAIGGISPDNIRLVAEMGFGSAAVLGALWKEPVKAIETFNRLKYLCS